jgi:hypothetical protein
MWMLTLFVYPAAELGTPSRVVLREERLMEQAKWREVNVGSGN